MKDFDVIVVGGGMAGLTAASYTSDKYTTLLIEKESSLGGLVGSFNMDGFVLDRGARGIIDSGIIFPMFKQLGIELEFLRNPIKMVVEEDSVDLVEKSDIKNYGEMLKRLYPQNKHEIDQIIVEIEKVMTYMDVLYGIENPLFIDKPYSTEYLKNTLFPWMLKFVPNNYKAGKIMEPIEEFLKKFTQSDELRHIIYQHFFEATPAFFALSYFTLYMQYRYPKGSTQSVVDALVGVLKKNQTNIHTDEEVLSIDMLNHVIQTTKDEYRFKKIIWSANIKLMYQRINNNLVEREQKKLKKMRDKYHSLKGSDSVLSLYVLLELEPSVFSERFGPHAFYTLDRKGLSNINLSELKVNDEYTTDIDAIFDWLKKYLQYTTYEISIPVLRDPDLAPGGKTALIISTLMDYHLIKHIEKHGDYQRLKDFVDHEIRLLFETSMPIIKGKLIKSIVATPITIEKRSYAHEGSLAGYSFSNHPFPAEYRFLRVSKSIQTCFKDLKQAGQFAFNPAGVPVAILTGKLAADQVIKELEKDD